MIGNPHQGEYPAYFSRYIGLVPRDNNILRVFGNQLEYTLKIIQRMNEKDGDFCYVPDKWSVKQVIGHLIL